MRSVHVYLLTVGREILVGRTLDTNAHWIAGEMTRLGGIVRQIACVDDEEEAIATEVRSARRLGGRVLVTTGGLGPTHDDLTLAGIARAAGVHLRVQRAARRIVEERYRALHAAGRIADPGVTPVRLKMARLPVGSIPLPNGVGTAPGMRLDWGGLSIFALPGVPSEMKAMFTGEVAPRVAALARRAGGGAWVEVSVATGTNDESALAAVLDALRTAFPDVYAKSHARGFGTGVDVKIILAAGAADEASARRRVQAARRFLQELLPGIGPRARR